MKIQSPVLTTQESLRYRAFVLCSRTLLSLITVSVGLPCLSPDFSPFFNNTTSLPLKEKRLFGTPFIAQTMNRPVTKIRPWDSFGV